MKKIGIMGGTFDPPHIGHLAMAQCVLDALMLDKVWFIPTGGITYKDSTHTLPPKTRLSMVEAAIAGNDRFEVNAMEVMSQKNSYTYETLEKLHVMYPDTEFVFIVGADSLDYMETWREPARIFSACTVAAVGREGYVQSKMLAKKRQLEAWYPQARIVLADMPILSVSSTQLRAWVKCGRSIRYLVPDAVLAYIEENGLYLDESQ